MAGAWSSTAPRRLWIVLGVIALFVAGYFGVGHAAAGLRARTVATPLDDVIPFVPWTVFVYAAVYTSAFLPIFLVRDVALFRQAVRAYVLVLLISFTAFLLYPVTSVGLRPDLSEMGASGFAGWGLRVIYRLDPPRNLFPSLHLAIAAVATAAVWKARAVYGWVAALWLMPIAVSVCTTKQHFALDALAGLALGAAASVIFLRGEAPDENDDAYFGWGGIVFYAGFLATFYFGAWLVYRWVA